MGFRRISEADMAGKGNLGRADTPGVSAGEMQRILDELPREVIAPALNELAGQLEGPLAAGLLGARLPEGLAEGVAQTVQGALDGLCSRIKAHEERADNPHGVTAAQAGTYTKAETDAAISQRVVEIGAGDMARAVYDPTGRRENVFAGADKAQAAAARAQAVAGHAAEAAAALAAELQVFSCTLLAGGWAAREAAAGGGYVQTVPCPGLLAAYDLEAPQALSTGIRATDAALKEGLDTLCEAGNFGETLNGQLRWVCYNSPPAADLPLRLRRTAAKTDGGDEPAGPGGSGEAV